MLKCGFGDTKHDEVAVRLARVKVEAEVEVPICASHGRPRVLRTPEGSYPVTGFSPLPKVVR